MNPAYQGQLDVFCAAYAVINAMRHINATRLLTCRAILHEALLDAARDEESFCALLEQRTDYVDWVDAMLSRLEKQGSLLTARPFPTHFPGPSAPSPAVLWDAIADWLRRGERNAVLLQFVRILYPTEAVIRHWTCCNDVVGDTLMLFDSSIEPGALHQLSREILRTTAPARFSSSRTPSDSSARGFKAEKDDSKAGYLAMYSVPKGSDSGNAAGEKIVEYERRERMGSALAGSREKSFFRTIFLP